jgi:hypothetical protein
MIKKIKAILAIKFWCRERDSNPRRRMPADLQSALVGRLSIPAGLLWSRQRDSNPRPAVYKTAALTN